MAAPSGYSQLVDLGKSLTGTDILPRIEMLGEAEIAGFLEANKDTLDSARRVLVVECSVPLEFDALYLNKLRRNVLALRDLALSFGLELTAAERNGALTQAVTIGLNIFALANAARRGGLVLDSLVAVALEDCGIERLRRLHHRLSLADSTTLANGILRLDSVTRESHSNEITVQA